MPLIFHTAKTERTDLRRGVELRAYDYLTKPFSENELLSAINGRLARFRHLKPYYDLKAGALDELLDDARAVGKLAVLAADRRAYPVRRKQDIYLEGDEPARVYLVQADRVKTVKTIEAGKELITGFYGPGEFFDYLALLGYTPHTDSAVAVDDSELVYIPQDDFSLLLLRNPAVGQQFIHLLAGRVREREQQLLTMAYSSIRRRVADALLRLYEPTAGDPQASIQLSRDDMAAMIGTAPESLIRTLSEFKYSGLIELTPKNIRVLEPEKLRQAHW